MPKRAMKVPEDFQGENREDMTGTMKYLRPIKRMRDSIRQLPGVKL